MSILPIGTIVYLKEGSQKLMILNRGVTIELLRKVMEEYILWLEQFSFVYFSFLV